MRLSKFLKNWWRRVTKASKTDAVLVILAYAAKIYTVAFAVWTGGAKFSSWIAPEAFGLWGFVVALAYATAQPYFPNHVSKKWLVEDLRRTKVLAVAISEISSAVWNHALKPEEKHELFIKLLAAIKSEVESITGDHESIYSNVALLLDDNGDRLKVVCRANHDRPLTSYRKTDLLISKTLNTGEVFYEPDCKMADKPYKAILGIPLISGPENSRMFVSGVVSIDSSEAHGFDGLEDEIEAKTLPYISLLKLVITTDETLKLGKWRQDVRKR